MKKNEKSKNIIIVVLIVMIIGLAGLLCYQTFVVNKESEKTNTTEKKDEIVKITPEDEEKMMKIAEIMYVDQKKFDELDNQTKLMVAFQLIDNNNENITGKELQQAIKKYFGQNATLQLEDIICDGHKEAGIGGSEISYKYNANTDKYEYNNEHQAHGGLSGDFGEATPIVHKDNITIEKDKYNFTIGVYYINSTCQDICRPTTKDDGKIYKAAKDVKTGKNFILDAATDSNLYEKDTEDEETYKYDYDKIYNRVKDKVQKYTAVFEIENSNLVFKEMKAIK